MLAKRTDIVAALEKVHQAAVEFLNDWSKGDFDLSTLATHDANALRVACLQYEVQKAQFIKNCHDLIAAHET